jgi:hypothetical protein
MFGVGAGAAVEVDGALAEVWDFQSGKRTVSRAIPEGTALLTGEEEWFQNIRKVRSCEFDVPLQQV